MRACSGIGIQKFPVQQTLIKFSSHHKELAIDASPTHAHDKLHAERSILPCHWNSYVKTNIELRCQMGNPAANSIHATLLNEDLVMLFYLPPEFMWAL